MSRSTPAPARLAAVVLGLCLAATSAACGQDAEDVAEDVEGRPWLVTVYYTAVESFHDGQRVDVTGCPALGCERRDEPLGSYPRTFADAVRDEGTGRITSGDHAGRYLNWSYDIGYWLDTAPRDASGGALEPFRSAAADGVPLGTGLRLLDCGRLDSDEAAPADVCEPLTAADWEIRDQFTPGLGGESHIDLYIGEEDTPDFTRTGRLYVTLRDARFVVRR